MRLTGSLVGVARVLMSDPNGRHYGYDIVTRSGFQTGTVYPLLQRMIDDGWLADDWERQSVAAARKRPPRRFYRLTGKGRECLEDALRQARSDPRFR